jgi:hypothetical protein
LKGGRRLPVPYLLTHHVEDRLLPLKQTAFLSIRPRRIVRVVSPSGQPRALGPPPSRGPAPAPSIPTQQTFRWFFVGGLVHRGGCLFGATALLLVRGSFSGADDGIRTRDPHLGNGMADVSCVSASLTSAPDLHVLGAHVSSVSPDGWS